MVFRGICQQAPGCRAFCSKGSISPSVAVVRSLPPCKQRSGLQFTMPAPLSPVGPPLPGYRRQKALVVQAQAHTYAIDNNMYSADDLCLLQDCQGALSFPATLPIIPFTPSEALAPGAIKVLNFYEDKDLELLDAVLNGAVPQGAGSTSSQEDDLAPLQRASSPSPPAIPNMFVHTTIEMGSSTQPCGITRELASTAPGALVAGDFVFFMSTLVQVLHVERTPWGAAVTIRGEGRVRITGLHRLTPYLTGQVWPVQDVVPLEVMHNTLHTASPAPPQPEHTALSHAQTGTLPSTTEEPGAATAHTSSAAHNLGRMVEELKSMAWDVHELLCKVGRSSHASQLASALQWADDPKPVMCNLGTRQSAADLYFPSPPPAPASPAHPDTQPASEAGEGAAATSTMLPCHLAHLDRATRLSFALLQLLPEAGKDAWGMSEPCRAALCTLDTHTRLQQVSGICKAARARLAAQSALIRIRSELR